MKVHHTFHFKIMNLSYLCSFFSYFLRLYISPVPLTNALLGSSLFQVFACCNTLATQCEMLSILQGALCLFQLSATSCRNQYKAASLLINLRLRCNDFFFFFYRSVNFIFVSCIGESSLCLSYSSLLGDRDRPKPRKPPAPASVQKLSVHQSVCTPAAPSCHAARRAGRGE